MDAHPKVTYVFMVGRCFHTLNECINFLEAHVPEGQFHWFLDIVSYQYFFTGDIVIPVELQLYQMHDAKVRNT